MNTLFEQQHSLREEINGDTCICYHRSPDENYHDFLLDYKVAFGKNVGLLDGPGIYATYDLESQFHSEYMIRNYGPYVFKMRARIDRVLMFDYDQFKKTNRIGNATEYDFIVQQFEELDLSPRFEQMGKQLQQAVIKQPYWTSDAAHKFSSQMKKVFKKTDTGMEGPVSGILFHGRQDGYVIVMWNAYAVVPYAVCNAPKLNMDLSKLEWKPTRKQKDLKQYSTKAVQQGIENHPLPELRIVATDAQLKSVTDSDEYKELLSITGAVLTSSPLQLKKFTLMFTLPNGDQFAIYPSGYIRKGRNGVLTPFTDKNGYIKPATYTEGFKWLLEKAKNPKDRFFGTITQANNQLQQQIQQQQQKKQQKAQSQPKPQQPAPQLQLNDIDEIEINLVWQQTGEMKQKKITQVQAANHPKIWSWALIKSQLNKAAKEGTLPKDLVVEIQMYEQSGAYGKQYQFDGSMTNKDWKQIAPDWAK